MKKLTPLLMLTLFALLPARLYAFDNTYYRSLAAMPLAVDACARSGQVSDMQLGHFVTQLNAADVPPDLFIETVRYAPYALRQPDFSPFVDSEISQGVTGAALITVIHQRLPRYGVTVRRIETTPAWVLRDDYIPRFDAYTTSRTTVSYASRYDDASYYRTRPRYDERTMRYLIEMPLAVATVSDLRGVRANDLGHFCGTLNRGYLPPEQFIDTVRYAPVVFVEQPGFIPFLDVQIGNGVIGMQLFNAIHPRLPLYAAPSYAYSPDYVLTDQYIPRTVRARFEQAVNSGGYTQQAYIAQPGYAQQQAYAQQPVYAPQQAYTAPVIQPSYAQQRGGRQRVVPQPAYAQNPYVAPAQTAHIPPGQAVSAERHARNEVRKAQKEAEKQARQNNGRGNGRGRVVQPQPVFVAPPPMASAAPAPAPVFVPQPQQNEGHGHGRGPGGEGPPGQKKEKGGKGHGKD
ncbi:MAG: hypothetical protein QOK37_2222 [Thermoanaerobaculia bacterium]|jgi:hypothetical protein|nr:hypothetical protein [Thermoanaerobaculia bacterium]